MDGPWTGPSEWFKYRCRSCNYIEWVEDIVVNAFPPEKPGGFPVIVCPSCGKSFRHDPSEPPKLQNERPE